MFDVIIVGARCGGSPTAMLAARRGLRVLLVDKSAFPSDIMGTHFMQPRGGAYLMRWGLWNDVLASNAPSWLEHSVTREGIGPVTGANCPKKLSARFREVHGWDLDFSGRDAALGVRYTAPRRKALDKILVDAAVAAGAELREESKIEGLLWDDGRVVGVRGKTKGGLAFEERARVVVGADGRHSRIAQEVGAQKSRERPRCTFCYWTYWEGLSLPKVIGRDSGLFLRGRLGISAFPTNDGLTHILVMGPKEWFPSFKANVENNYQYVVDFCAPQLGAALRECRRAERIYGTVDQPQYFHTSHGPGWALVGDAGYSKDQCTAIGMTHAFRDSELLAGALHDGLAGKSASLDAALAEYQARRDKDASDYYDFVCGRAECNPPRLQDLQLFAALRGNPDLIAPYFGAIGDATHVREFFAPENLALIVARAKPDFPEPEILRNFEAMTANYDVDPFSTTAGRPESAVPPARLPELEVVAPCDSKAAPLASADRLRKTVPVSLEWPKQGLTRIPYQVYHDPEIYAREQERIFRGRSWNFVCLEAEIPAPGDFTRSFVGDTAVVATRDAEGTVNVFENRCSHRGVQFCLENSGNTKLFTCPYHQWSFDLRGRLRGVPFRKGIEGLGGMPADFDLNANNLRRLNVTTRNGVVFASFADELPKFEDYLGETNLAYFDRVFNGKPLRIIGKQRQRVSANWKLVVENIRDPYHATLLHVFFVTFGLWRADMEFSARFCPTGGTAIQFNSPSKKSAKAVANETKSLRSDLKLQDRSVVDVVAEFPDGKSGAMHTIWPSLIVQQTVNSLAVRHAVPHGPRHFELHWTFFGYADDSPEMVERRLRHANLYGPSGLVSIDDSEVLQLAQKGSGGSPEQAAFVELGGSGTDDSEGMVNEVMIRAFYRYYREVMEL